LSERQNQPAQGDASIRPLQLTRRRARAESYPRDGAYLLSFPKDAQRRVDSGPSGLMANGGGVTSGHSLHIGRKGCEVGNRTTLIRGGITMAVSDPQVRAV